MDVHTSSIDVDKTALVLIDVQNGFISDYTSRCLPQIHKAATDKRFPVTIATRFYNPKGSPFRSFIQWERLSDEADTALDQVVEKHANVIIDKPTYGAGQQIAEQLRRHGLTQALFMGIDTDVCVLQNAAQLFDMGYRTFVDLSGCATNGGPEADAAAVRLMQRTVGGNQVLMDYTAGAKRAV